MRRIIKTVVQRCREASTALDESRTELSSFHWQNHHADWECLEAEEPSKVEWRHLEYSNTNWWPQENNVICTIHAHVPTT